MRGYHQKLNYKKLKQKRMENKDYNLEELLRKSPTEITHEEMLFVLENMNLEAITAAAMERQNLITKKSDED
jgi:hypothetical protein